jgi:hypothetical protein
MINWDDFEKVEIRSGTIIEVNDFPQAKKPAYRLSIDFGVLGVKAIIGADHASLFKRRTEKQAGNSGGEFSAETDSQLFQRMFGIGCV